ncbi:MAG: hypothetical protein HY840_02740 [Bacteroidetes bacterium]|nr:hypothetical protein [Bacteroidota bacterium]
MNFIRTHIISKILCFLFALHVFNISVDPPDADLDSIPEDLSVNDMESISEIICEQILHIDNLFPESDEQDDDDKGAPVDMDVIFSFYNEPTTVFIVAPYVEKKLMHTIKNEEIIGQFCSDVVPPPPKA